MNIPTPADPVMEMARKIAQEIEGDRDGSYSNQVYLGALAAIRATTEAAAKYIREHPIPHPAFDERLCCDGRDCGCLGSTVGQQEAHYLAEDLSANKHIKGSDDV